MLKKELPLVVLFDQKKIGFQSKGFSLLSGLHHNNKNTLFKNNFMTNTEQIKGIVERLGALRRYL